MENTVILISAILILLTVSFLGLIIYFLKLKKRVDLFFKNGDKDIESLLTSQLRRLDKQEKEIAKILEEILTLKNLSKRSFQKLGLVRFNPFKNVGGDQSFSVALLDLENNGFVFSSIYGQDGNRVYAKPIANSKSEYVLSEEEKEAISKAQTVNGQ